MTPVTYHRDPHDLGMAGFVPTGVLAAQQHAREDAEDLRRWRVHDLRWQVFHRLRQLSVNHAGQAWQRRYRAPLAPYALGYVFTQPAADVAGGAARVTVVRAATRLWKAGPESRHPISLLRVLTEQALGRDPRLGWDLREEIANRCDDGMADDAVYAGLGLSSLDTHTGTWAQVCQTAGSELDIPGLIVYLSTQPADPAAADLGEHQVFVADRRSATDLNATTIHSHGGLDTFQGSAPYPVAEVSLHTLYHESGHGPLLQAMRNLDLVLHAADQQRRTMASGRHATRWPS